MQTNATNKLFDANFIFYNNKTYSKYFISACLSCFPEAKHVAVVFSMQQF